MRLDHEGPLPEEFVFDLKEEECLKLLSDLQSGTSQPGMTASQSVPTQKVSDSARIEELEGLLSLLRIKLQVIGEEAANPEVLTICTYAVSDIEAALKSRGTAEEEA